MPISLQEQNTLIKLVIGMLGIAPGYTYLPVVTKGYQDLGNHYPDAATALASLPQFKALYPSGMSATDFAAKFLGSMGLQSNATAQRLAVDMFNAGVPPEQIILQAVLAIDASNAPEYASARALLNNRAEIAYYHAQILGRMDTDFAVLRKVLELVTDAPSSVALVKGVLNPPPPQPEEPAAPPPPPPPPPPPANVFTTGTDTFTTTDGSVVYTATLGTGATLTANDSLHGNGNTLNITNTSGTLPDQWPTGLDLSGVSTLSLTTAGNAGSQVVYLDPRFTGTQNFTLHASGTGADYLRGGNVNLTVESQASSISVISGFASLDLTANHLTGTAALQLSGTGGAITLHSPTGASSLTITTNALTLTGGFTDADSRLTDLTIATPGSLSRIDAVSASALTSLTVTGKTVLGTSNNSRFSVGDAVTTLDFTGLTTTGTAETSYLVLGGTGTTGDYKLGSRNVNLDMNNTHGNAVISLDKSANFSNTIPTVAVIRAPSTVQIDMPGEAGLTHSSATNYGALTAAAAANPGIALWAVIANVTTAIAYSETNTLGAGTALLIGVVGVHNPTYDAVSGNIIVG